MGDKMRDSDKEEIRSVIKDTINSLAKTDFAAVEQENKGLRASLAMAMKNPEGLIPVQKIERSLTLQGVRTYVLEIALDTHRATTNLEITEAFTDEDVLSTARKYETFINGGFVSSELPETE
jgi:hypothetical protein